ncbi:MAG TPA: DUF2490 domain-containing protein [Smithella sp.]|nr:DUF2490 domain-containing protein [Smithella sp.]
MMKRKRLAQKTLAFLIFFSLYPSSSLADHDTALRTDLNFQYKISDQFKIVSYIFLQADRDMSNYDYLEWGAGLQYQTIWSWLSFLLYYQQGYSKIEQDDWRLEQKPSININTSATFHPIRISNQIRYEYRFTPDWNDYRIKNYLEISCLHDFFQPLVGWELFYENRDKAVMLHRIKFGFSKNIDKHLSWGAYYRIDYANVDHGWDFRRQLIGLQLTARY